MVAIALASQILAAPYSLANLNTTQVLEPEKYKVFADIV